MSKAGGRDIPRHGATLLLRSIQATRHIIRQDLCTSASRATETCVIGGVNFFVSMAGLFDSRCMCSVPDSTLILSPVLTTPHRNLNNRRGATLFSHLGFVGYTANLERRDVFQDVPFFLSGLVGIPICTFFWRVEHVLFNKQNIQDNLPRLTTRKSLCVGSAHTQAVSSSVIIDSFILVGCCANHHLPYTSPDRKPNITRRSSQRAQTAISSQQISGLLREPKQSHHVFNSGPRFGIHRRECRVGPC
jgi:hypothetical protein